MISTTIWQSIICPAIGIVAVAIVVKMAFDIAQMRKNFKDLKNIPTKKDE